MKVQNVILRGVFCTICPAKVSISQKALKIHILFENFKFNLEEFKRTSDQEHWFEAVKSLKYLVELVEELQSEFEGIH